MPLHNKFVSVPGGTNKTSPVTTTVEVDRGRVREARVFADTGVNGEVHTELRYGDARIFPTAGSDTEIPPGNTGPVPVDDPSRGRPTEFTWRSWSPNASFSHELFLQVVTDRRDPADNEIGLLRSIRDRLAGRRREAPDPEDIFP